MPFSGYSDAKVGIEEIDQRHQSFVELLHGLHSLVNKSCGNPDILPMLKLTAAHVRELLEVEMAHIKVHLPHREAVCSLHFENVICEIDELVSGFEVGSFLRMEDYVVCQIYGIMRFTKDHFCLKPLSETATA